jgi:hypothetical protein
LIDETFDGSNGYRGARFGAGGLRLEQQDIDIDINVDIDFHIHIDLDKNVDDLRDAGRRRPDHRRLHP